MITTVHTAADVLAAAAVSNDSMGTVSVATVIILVALGVGIGVKKMAVKITAFIVFGIMVAGTGLGVTLKQISGDTVKTGTSTVDSVSK